MDIDAIIAEATQEVAIEQPASQEASSEVQVEESKPVETQEDVGKKPDSELTPEQLAKREKNRISHMNSKLAEQRRLNRELQARLEQQPTPNQPTQNTGKPNADNFDNWDDYTEALADWKFEQKISVLNKQSHQSQQVQTQNNAKALRVQEIKEQEAIFASKNPEYAELVTDNQHFFNGLTREIAEGLADTKSPQLAIYALMKEGRLDDLYDMSPTRLAAELATAEIRGESYLSKPTPITNAPAPLSAAKGNTVSKSINNMNWPELKVKLGL